MKGKGEVYKFLRQEDALLTVTDPFFTFYLRWCSE